jgi:hypothetical protein
MSVSPVVAKGKINCLLKFCCLHLFLIAQTSLL